MNSTFMSVGYLVRLKCLKWGVTLATVFDILGRNKEMNDIHVKILSMK